MSKMALPDVVRKFVRDRAHGYCEYCQSRDDCGTGTFAVEHILPYAHGGSDDPGNLGYACSGCNGHKFTKVVAWDPVSEKHVSLYNPRLEIWNEHFKWDETATMLIGQTPTGRATIVALQMNRVALVNLRGGMVLLGIHPPESNPTITNDK